MAPNTLAVTAFAPRRGRWLLAALAAALGLLLSLGQAQAHALLLRTDPAANQSLTTAPTSVNLWFSEPVEVEPDAIVITDAAGKRFDAANAQVSRDDVTKVTVGLKSLGQGAYTVRWRIVSVDTHVVAGAFQFGVGVQVSGETLSEAAGEASPLEALLRWLSLVGLSLLVGGFWFRQLVLAPAGASAGGESGELTVLKAMRLGALALLALNLAWLWYQVAQVNSSSPLAALDPEAISKVVMRSRFGMVWLGRMMCVVALLGIIDLIEGDRRSPGNRTNLWWWGGGAIGMVLLLTGSLLGHPASKSPLLLSLGLDWLHVAATAIWLGGLFHFVLVAVAGSLRAQAGTRLQTFSALWPNFSRTAVIGVQVLVASGILSAWVQMGRIDALASSDYGRTLLIKLAVALPLLGIGALNLLRYAPRLDRAVQQPGNRGVMERLVVQAGTSLRGEAGLGLAVLGLAGLLASTPPPYSGGGAAGTGGTVGQSAAALPTGVTLAQGATQTMVLLNLSPATIGSNNLTVQVRDQVGQPVSGATVQLRAAAQGASGASVITLDARDGAYKGITQLTQQGQWSFDVRVQQAGKPDEQATFTLSLPLPGAQERLAKAQEAMNKLTSLKEQQVLRGSAGSVVTYDYRYNAPNAMAVSANDGSDVVIIGRSRYNKVAGQWTQVDAPAELAYKFPDYQFTLGAQNVTDLGSEPVDGVPTEILAYEQEGTGYFYRLWIDDAGLVRRLKMTGPSHFMDAHLFDFNVPNAITPPQ